MFDSGFTVFRIRGIPVKLHVTLIAFVPYVAFVAAAQFRAIAEAMGVPLFAIRLPTAVWGAILAVALFASILVHELAHSLVALKSGVRVRSITLMMLGGVSRMEHDVPEDREAWMAFAGPLASFGLALAGYAAFRLTGGTGELAVGLLVFSATNLVLGVFNLLPAFPMDGGRVLRGLLARRMGMARATRFAARLGKAMAVAFALFGLLSFNVLLVLIAAFVYMGAAAEQTRLEARGALEGLPIGSLLSGRLGEAHAWESARDVAQRLLAENLVGARVVDGVDEQSPKGHRRTLGVVTARDLAKRVARGGSADVTVGAAMRTDLPRVRDDDDAATTLDALTTADVNAVLVVDRHDQVIGLVTAADLERAATMRRLSRH